MIKYNELPTDVGAATKIYLTLVRMASHGPDDHLMVHHGALRKSSVWDLCHGGHRLSMDNKVIVDAITGHHYN